MGTVSPIRHVITPFQLPRSLKDLKRFLVWKGVDRKNGKIDKIPYYVDGNLRTETHGSPEDLDKLVSFNEALDVAMRSNENWWGVGYAPMASDNINAFDIDNVIDQHGNILPEVVDLIDGYYSEISPSGRGIRCFARGDLADAHSVNNPKFKFNFEVFHAKGFVTITGNQTWMSEVLGWDDNKSVNEKLRGYYKERFGNKPSRITPPTVLRLSHKDIEEILETIDPDVGYHDWLYIGMALHFETKGAGFEIWNRWSAKGDKYADRNELMSKWRSFNANNVKAIGGEYLLEWGARSGIYPSAPGLGDEFEILLIEDIPTAPSSKAVGFYIKTVEQFKQNKEPEWIVRNLMPKAEMGLIIGQPASGKSAYYFAIAAAAVSGQPWFNVPVKQMGVLIIVAEGASGFRSRVLAWERHYNIDLNDKPLYFIDMAPNLMDENQAKFIAEEINKIGDIGMVFIDTLAQVSPGSSENDSKDMGKVLANCKIISKKTGAMINIVHHQGKDLSKGARGWSGLRGAADYELEVVNYGNYREAAITKQKDGPDDFRSPFHLQPVVIGLDENGDEKTSIVAVPYSGPRDVKKKAQGKWERLITDAIRNLNQDNSPIKIDSLIDHILEKTTAPENGARDYRSKNIARALKNMADTADCNFVLVDDELIFD